MTTILIVAGCLVGAMYVLAPLAVRATYVHKAEPQLEEIEPGALPVHVAEAFEPACRKLEEHGYAYAGWYHLDAVKGTTSWHGLMRNEERRDMALVSHTESKAVPDRPTLKTTAVEFMTLFRDDHRVETTNAPEPLPRIGQPDEHKQTQLPGLDVDRLCHAHAQLVAQMRPMEPQPLPLPGQEAQIIQDDLWRHIRGCVKAGYYVRNKETGDYGLTLKGAYVLSWGLLPPLKQLRGRRLASRSTRLLRSFNLDDAERRAA